MRSEEQLGGRLALLDIKGLGDEQRRLVEYLEQTRLRWASASGFEARLADGRLIGPFNVFLYSPEMAQAFNEWADVESADSTLASQTREVVILTVGAAWHADYELYAHSAAARTAGVDDETIDAILAGEEPVRASGAVRTAWQFTHELVTRHAVPDAVYSVARSTFGERGLADMLNLIGIYLNVCAQLNAFQVPVPPART